MVAVGLILIWASYTLFWLAVVRFYSMDVTFMDLVVPGRYDLCKFHQDYAAGKDLKTTGGCKEKKTSPAPQPTQPTPTPTPVQPKPKPGGGKSKS